MDAMDRRSASGTCGSEAIGTGISQYPRILNSHDRNPGMNPADTIPKMGMVEKLNANNNHRHSQKRKRIACKECRQAKLRCDGLKDGLGPCIRCSRLSLSCQVDTAFKRVNKKLKINEIAEELQQLRSVVAGWNVGNQPLGPLRPSDTTSHRQSPQSLLTPTSIMFNSQREINDFRHQHDEAVSSPTEGVRVWETADANPRQLPDTEHSAYITTSSSQSLDDIKLTGTQIDNLFQEFFDHYHHFLEILDPSTPPDVYYKQSPVLFWAIISVAARRYDDDVTLLGNLCPNMTRLLWSSASQPPLPSYTIQALLLLSMWPFPVNTQWKDPSLLMISVARSAAMQNGVHRPETMQDFQRVKTQLAPEEFHAAVKLWAGCYIAAQSATTSAGQPSLSSSDWTIDRACEPGNNYTVPDNLRYHLLIQRFLARVDEAMAKRTCSPTGHPIQRESDGLMRLLECDLDDLERWIGKEAGEAHRIALAMVSMQLRSYYFFESSATEMRKQGLLRAYSATLNFISKLANEDAKNDFIKYVPNIFYQILNTAGMLVMKIINSSYARYVDIEEGKRSFNIVLSLLRRAILEDNDLRGRGGKILAQLWTIHHSRTIRRGQEPNLKVQSRLGASVLHDGLWAWREEFGGQKSPPSRPSDSFSNTPPSLLPASPAHTMEQHPPAASKFAIVSPQLAFDVNSTETQEINLESCNNQIQQHQMAQSNALSEDCQGIGHLDPDLANFDGIWDIGFPSLLPIDLDSHSYPPSI